MFPGDFGDASDPRGPDDHGVTMEEAVCLVRGEVTPTFFSKGQTQTQCSSKVLSVRMLPPCAFCLASCVCVCFYMFPLGNDRVNDGCCDKLIAD